jgi:hypothetical protein
MNTIQATMMIQRKERNLRTRALVASRRLSGSVRKHARIINFVSCFPSRMEIMKQLKPGMYTVSKQ